MPKQRVRSIRLENRTFRGFSRRAGQQAPSRGFSLWTGWSTRRSAVGIYPFESREYSLNAAGRFQQSSKDWYPASPLNSMVVLTVSPSSLVKSILSVAMNGSPWAAGICSIVSSPLPAS